MQWELWKKKKTSPKDDGMLNRLADLLKKLQKDR